MAPESSMNRHRGLGLLLEQAFPLFLCQFLRFENHHDLLESSGERKRHLARVGLGDRSPRVFADVERLIERETNADGPGDLSLRHLLSVHEERADGALPESATVVREGEAHDVISRGYALIRSDAELVPRLVRECVHELGLAVFHDQTPATEAAPDRGQDATRALLRDVHLGRDRPGLVLEVRRRALWNANHPLVVRELGAPARQARADRRIGSTRETRVERIDVVLLRLDVEGGLELLELGGILRCQIVRLAEVLADLVKLPLEVIRVGLRADRHPRKAKGRSAGNPTVLVDRAIADQLEVLRGVTRRSVGVVEGVYEAGAFERLLLHTVHRFGRRHADGLVDGWYDVDDVAELRPYAALFLDARGPRDHHAIARAAEVRRDLFRPLHGRIHRERPPDWIVVVGRGASQLVDHREQIGKALRDAIGRFPDLVRRAL